jgi:guanylate kinase
MEEQRKRGLLVIISGPSGSGKTTICKRLAEMPGFKRSISWTTRAARRGEVQDRDYHFVSQAEFERGLREGGFIEHARVFGQYYGTPREPLEQGIEEGQAMLLGIDVQGALQLQELELPAQYIFVVPPDLVELKRRLRDRRTESEEDLEYRFSKAVEEMGFKDRYDHVVVNDELERAVAEVADLVAARRKTL